MSRYEIKSTVKGSKRESESDRQNAKILFQARKRGRFFTSTGCWLRVRCGWTRWIRLVADIPWWRHRGKKKSQMITSGNMQNCSPQDVFDPDFPAVFRQNARISLIRYVWVSVQYMPSLLKYWSSSSVSSSKVTGKRLLNSHSVKAPISNHAHEVWDKGHSCCNNPTCVHIF